MPNKRGDLKEPLGGPARFGGKYMYCGNCSPEPLDYITSVHMLVRKVGIVMQGATAHLDVIECPKCGHQILR